MWIALAEPFAPPPARDRSAVSRRVLALTNQARAQARRCGATPYAAAPPLSLDATLEHAARDYARQMATSGYMDHTGHDGSSPSERVTRGGYRWREMGENLASGVMSAEQVVGGWLGSPDHCANLMDPLFRQMGVAYAVNPHDRRASTGRRSSARRARARRRRLRGRALRRAAAAHQAAGDQIEQPEPGHAVGEQDIEGEVDDRRVPVDTRVACTPPMSTAAALTSSSIGRTDGARRARRCRGGRRHPQPCKYQIAITASPNTELTYCSTWHSGPVYGADGHRRAQRRDARHHPAVACVNESHSR